MCVCEDRAPLCVCAWLRAHGQLSRVRVNIVMCLKEETMRLRCGFWSCSADAVQPQTMSLYYLWIFLHLLLLQFFHCVDSILECAELGFASNGSFDGGYFTVCT